jgi:pyruvate formate lyase activating enzyme
MTQRSGSGSAAAGAAGTAGAGTTGVAGVPGAAAGAAGAAGAAAAGAAGVPGAAAAGAAGTTGVAGAVSYPPISSLALDPIEKKPLAQFYPGTMILSVGFYGCSFHCPFCQNSSISQVSPSQEPMFSSARTTDIYSGVTPDKLVAKALELRQVGNIGIAYTYSEPLIHIGFIRETAIAAREVGLKNVLVTNGFASEETAKRIFPLMDAMNIDLKAFGSMGDSFYAWIGAPGALQIVLRNIAFAASLSDLHLEVTTLIVPSYNDNPEDMNTEAAWLANLDADIPLHITRFFPAWQMRDAKPTPVELIHKMTAIAKQHLRNVYAGNI